MGLKIAETANRREQRESFIETSYLGKEPNLFATQGEAFYDLLTSSWKYRPFNQGVEFFKVAANELSCANDSGWVKGEYLGAKNLTKIGKASWNEVAECWDYKPKGAQKTVQIPEGEFKMVRDEDY